MNAFEKWQVIVNTVQAGIILMAFFGALYIGFKQNEINDKLRLLQDYVAVAAVPDANSVIKLINTGKINLYIWGFDMPGNNQRLDKPRLISAGSMEAAYYWIPLPTFDEPQKLNPFEFKLYLTDQFGNKWISEHGGEAELSTVKIDNKTVPELRTRMWSYKTFKSEWSFNHSVGGVQRTQEPQYIKTDLRLQFFGDQRIPQEVSSDNVASWFAYFSPSLAIIPKDAHGNMVAGGLEVPPNWAIFVALDKPAKFRQAIVTFSNPEIMPITDVHMANSRVIAISTRGQVPAGVLNIHIIK